MITLYGDDDGGGADDDGHDGVHGGDTHSLPHLHPRPRLHHKRRHTLFQPFFRLLGCGVLPLLVYDLLSFHPPVFFIFLNRLIKSKGEQYYFQSQLMLQPEGMSSDKSTLAVLPEDLAFHTQSEK